jgi:hypothetical protein
VETMLQHKTERIGLLKTTLLCAFVCPFRVISF